MHTVANYNKNTCINTVNIYLCLFYKFFLNSASINNVKIIVFFKLYYFILTNCYFVFQDWPLYSKNTVIYIIIYHVFLILQMNKRI